MLEWAHYLLLKGTDFWVSGISVLCTDFNCFKLPKIKIQITNNKFVSKYGRICEL